MLRPRVFQRRIFQLIARTFDGFDTCWLSSITVALKHVDGLSGFLLACVDNDFDAVRHGFDFSVQDEGMQPVFP